MRGPENSEVLSALVAVAVIVCPAGTAAVKLKVNGALPFELVVILLWATKVLPSSPDGLEKNWRVKVMFGVLLRLPLIVRVLPVVVVEDRAGLF